MFSVVSLVDAGGVAPSVAPDVRNYKFPSSVDCACLAVAVAVAVAPTVPASGRPHSSIRPMFA